MRRREDRSSTPLIGTFVVVATAIYAIGCGGRPGTESNTDSDPDLSTAVKASEPRGVRVNTPQASPGYVYFAPLLSDTTYLVDTDGQVVHTWKSDYAPSGGVYLLDNGHLIRGAREPEVPTFSGGGQGGRIQEFTWDGEVVSNFTFANEDYLLHHDVAVLPNGNLLAIAWERKGVEEVRRAGRRQELTPEAGLWPDMVVEFERESPDEARIVWEWHMWDHTIQNYDETLDNYGEPSEHPELIDMNGELEPPKISEEELARLKALGYVPSDTTPENLRSDFMHTNAIAYNGDLDQIVLSVLKYNEVWIIDHSTTVDEAAGHTGGRWGRGGDLLYRWGNPRVYGRGDVTQQRLFGQHDPRWIPNGMPGAGHLLLFNNNLSGPEGDYSAVFEITLPTDDEGRLVVPDTEAIGPETVTWSYTAPNKISMFSSFISGAHRLADGHTMITSGAQGRFLEVNSEGETVWEYWTPYSGDVKMPDGSRPHPTTGFDYPVFRATKILPDHPALAGRDLTPLAPQPPIVLPSSLGEGGS